MIFEKKNSTQRIEERKRLRAKRKKSRKNWRSNPPFLFSWSLRGCGEKTVESLLIRKLFVSLQRDNTKRMDISVEYLEEAQSYIDNMPEKARKKMFHNVGLVCTGVKDTRIFKKLTDSGIWEFRAEYESNEYRLLSFWDNTKSSFIIATHGFDKKTQKTPKGEIEHAERIRDEYYKSK